MVYNRLVNHLSQKVSYDSVIIDPLMNGYNINGVGGAITQAPERPVGKSQGGSARHWMDPFVGGWSVKVHCR